MQLINITEPNNSSNQESKSMALGIDFGTTHSLIAIANQGNVTVIPNKNNHELMQSVVNISDNGTVMIGLQNKNNSQNLKKLITISSIKRLFGKSTQEICKSPVLYSLVSDIIDTSSSVPKFNINGKSMMTAQIAAEIFIYLKKQAEKYLSNILTTDKSIDIDNKVKQIVVSVPAYFDDAAKGEVILAAKIAGFDVLRLIAEPTAAAYAYGFNRNFNGCLLVYDLGGGTFDVSILQMHQGVLQVIAIGGDNILGGDDIDHLIAQHFCNQYKITQCNQLINVSRQIKELLSSQNKVSIQFKQLHLSLDRSSLETIIKPIIEKTLLITQETINSINNIKLDAIVLIGGSTRLPIIKRGLQSKFNVPVYSDIDPDKAVAWGAALQAENLTTKHLNSLLIDALPLSLGLELYGGIVEKIILRNSPIPIAITKEFTTYADNQTAMQFHILQGEREIARDCKSLAHFELQGLPLKQAGHIKIEVTFSVDADGILSVSAFESETGRLHTLDINPSYGLNTQQVDQILTQAYENATQDHNTKLLYETKLNAKLLISKLENVTKDMKNVIPHNQLQLALDEINQLKALIKSDNRASIIKQSKQLEQIAQHCNEYILDGIAEKSIKGKHIDEI